MKKNELKKILKPLIKECIKEVIFEDGTLSGIISEVAQGLSSVQSTAPQQIVKEQATLAPKVQSVSQSEGYRQAKQQLEEVKNSLAKTTGLSGIFENTTPMHSSGGASSRHGALSDVDPTDPGVDISGIIGVAGKAWGQLK